MQSKILDTFEMFDKAMCNIFAMLFSKFTLNRIQIYLPIKTKLKSKIKHRPYILTANTILHTEWMDLIRNQL